MAPSTRLVTTNNNNGDEGITREYFDSQLTEMRNLIATLELQQNQAMNQGRQDNQFGRLVKVEFPKFQGDDVRGWAFRCDQFFSMDNTPNEEKVKIVSVYWSDKDLLWHRQFLSVNGKNVGWEVYKNANIQIFGSIFEDPMSALKNAKAIGTLGQHVVHILVDCGSTHNFLDKNMAKKLGCSIRPTGPLTVTVANGNNLVTTSECKNFQWKFDKTTFTTDVMLLPLGGCKMVLGIQRLATLEDIKCNFKELRMEFKYGDKKVQLRGTHKSNVVWLNDKKSIPVTVDGNIQAVLENYADVFSIPVELAPQRTHDHKIPLVGGALPVNIRPYRHPPT
uniref:Retrotransposable element Tf2 n=1 Tax=Tanacetum cinerariifolium TaxID=118510 RepID=A0A6L2P099_TANCI|nr:retrotransposable element Tf2 [Tanacetum cinerariifolium]